DPNHRFEYPGDEGCSWRYAVSVRRQDRTALIIADQPASRSTARPGGGRMKPRYAATVFCLITALTAGLVPAPAGAADDTEGRERPIRLFASARFGPIGAIKMSSLTPGAVAVD